MIPPEEQTAASGYLQEYENKLPNGFLDEIKARHKEIAADRHVTARPYLNLPRAFGPLLAALIHTMDGKPEPGESYGNRIRRVLKGKKIIDWASGYGLFIKFLNDHGAKATGVEFDRDVVALAQKNKIKIIQGDIIRDETLGGKSHHGKYDVATTSDFFEPNLFNDKEWDWSPYEGPSVADHALKTIHNSLKSGGYAIHSSFGKPQLTTNDLLKADFEIIQHGSGTRQHVSIARKPA
ncbi:hypothetical protein HY994_01240 [Candidatus Micrarchaeota archaeon]|nr:hypothetical protein [Candidatus Micrarchaeota archaeon]